MAQADSKTNSKARAGRKSAAKCSAKSGKAVAANVTARGSDTKLNAEKTPTAPKKRSKNGGKNQRRKTGSKMEASAGRERSSLSRVQAENSTARQQATVNSNADARLALDSRLTIKNIAALLAALETSPLEIDAGAVEQVDTAALQVLVSYANTARAAGRDVHWLAGNGQLPHALALAGLSNLIPFDAHSAAELMDDGLCPVF